MTEHLNPYTQKTGPDAPAKPSPNTTMSVDEAIARLRTSVRMMQSIREVNGLYDETPEILLAIALEAKEARQRANTAQSIACSR